MGLRGPLLLFKSPLLSYCILSYPVRQLSFGGLFFSEEEKERVGSKEKGGTRGTARNWGRRNCGRDAFYERITYFQ